MITVFPFFLCWEVFLYLRFSCSSCSRIYITFSPSSLPWYCFPIPSPVSYQSDWARGFAFFSFFLGPLFPTFFFISPYPFSPQFLHIRIGSSDPFFVIYFSVGRGLEEYIWRWRQDGRTECVHGIGIWSCSFISLSILFLLLFLFHIHM